MKPGVYYPAAEFHRLTFQDKFLEAINILTNLGANKIHVEHQVGWSEEFALNQQEPLATAGMATARKSLSHFDFSARLAGNREPTLPDNLAWFPSEPSWQRIADMRLSHGLQEFSLSVEYRDDFNIQANIRGAKWFGLNLGGKFIKHKSTIWRLTGTFGETTEDTTG